MELFEPRALPVLEVFRPLLFRGVIGQLAVKAEVQVLAFLQINAREMIKLQTANMILIVLGPDY